MKCAGAPEDMRRVRTAQSVAVVLLHHHFVNFNASVGTNHCAGGAADAGIFILGVGEVVAAIVDLLRLQSQHIARTSHHAKVATLASFSLDGYSSVNFCHVS